MRVFATPAEAASSEGAGAEKEAAISFLKEQQWTLDFGTALVEQRAMRESLIAPGEVRQVSGGEALVTASVSGRLEAGSLVPKVGTAVSKGEIVARLFPRVDNPADRTGLELAINEEETVLSLAQKETARAERLVNAGAVPSRRLEEAKAAQATSEARLKARGANLYLGGTAFCPKGLSKKAWGTVFQVPGFRGLLRAQFASLGVRKLACALFS